VSTSQRTITLIGADGTRRILACSTDPYQLGVDAQLWGTAPYAHATRAVAGIPGERIDSVQALPRTFALPVEVSATTELGIDQQLAALGELLDPAHDVRIRVRRSDGTEREISARCTSGRTAIAALARNGVDTRNVRVPLVFTAHFPFWRETTASPLQSGPTTFQDGLGGGINTATVTNPGVTCWPDFTATGYAENLEVMNLTTGQVWRVLEILQVGATLQVVTDPRSAGVYLNGVLAWNVAGVEVLDPLSELWPLLPGPNEIQFRANTPTGAEAIGQLTIRWHPIYETP
jgi:hypothetical protein